MVAHLNYTDTTMTFKIYNKCQYTEAVQMEYHQSQRGCIQYRADHLKILQVFADSHGIARSRSLTLGIS